MFSYSRLYCTQGPSLFIVKISKCTIQNQLFNECYALFERFGGIRIHVLWTRRPKFRKCPFEGYHWTIQSLWPTSSAWRKGWRMAGWWASRHSRFVSGPSLLCRVPNIVHTDYLLYGRLYIPTGRLDALYSIRLSPTLQAVVAAISDPPMNARPELGARSNVSNLMVSLQHDVGKWCTEYTWSAEDGMWGVKFLHNFGKVGGGPATIVESSDSPTTSSRVKRIDEEDPVEGGLRGRLSAGAEFYISAKEKSAGGECSCIYQNVWIQRPYQCLLAYASQPCPMQHLLHTRYPRLLRPLFHPHQKLSLHIHNLQQQ